MSSDAMTDNTHHHHHHDHGAAESGTVKDPVCGMSVDPQKTPASHALRRSGLFLLQSALPREIHRRPGEICRAEAVDGAPSRAAWHDLDLPDASRDPAGQAWRLPDLRHGARARPASRRSGPESRTRRYDAAILDRRGARAAGRDAGNGRACPMARSASLRCAAALGLAAIRARHAVVLWAGWPFFARGWASLRHRSLNMFTLIALGTGAAYLYSLVATSRRAVPARPFAARWHRSPVYFEAAAVITVLVLLGQVLELRARERTGGAIRALLDLAPKIARRIRADGGEEECRSTGCSVAIACACGRAMRYRSMAA